MTLQKSCVTLGLGQKEIGKSTTAQKIIVLVRIGGGIVVLLRSDYSKKSF